MKLHTAFLAAGATALPALAVRAASDPGSAAFPGGPYFVIGCGVSHLNNDDPIALPGQPGKSHNHTFIGNRNVDAATTPASLLGGESSCGDVGDASAYWVPTLFDGTRPQPLSVVGWACGGFGAMPRSASVLSCPEDRALHLRATFPNCWNGRDVDSADHPRHLAYATSGRCPARTLWRSRASC